MATLIDVVRKFYQKLSEKPFPANVSSLYFVIVMQWNELKRPPEITVSTSRLKELSGIKQKDSFYRALRALSSGGLIKYKLHSPLIDVRIICDGVSESLKSKALLSIPKTKTECAREAEPVVAKIENRTTGKYAHMTLAEMRAARKAELSTKGATANDGELSNASTGGNRSGKEVALGTDDKGRGSDTGDSDDTDGGRFL